MKQYNTTARGKLFVYFQQRLRMKQSTRGWYRADCIYCGRPQAMGINLGKYKAHCFGCLEKINPLQLLMDMEGFTHIKDAYQFLITQKEYEAYKDFEIKHIDVKPVELPSSYRLITEQNSYLGRFAQAYLKKRGFKLKEMEAAGVGYCTCGEYAGYIIFPCYLNNRLIFYQGRKFIDIGPKMRNPELEKFGIGKTQVFYNGDALFIYDRIDLVESITNSLTLGPRAIASFGKELSPWQMSTIIKSPVQRVTFLFDDDAYEGGIKQAMQLVHYKKVKVVRMPKGLDVNDIGRKETIKLKNATPWVDYMDLIKLKNQIADEKRSLNSHNRERIGTSPKRGF